MLKKYGVDHNWKIKDSFKKKKETWLRLHGVDNPSKLEEVKKKKIQMMKINGTSIHPMIGKNEQKILDDIELKENIKIDRNYIVDFYYPDGYCHETNTIYEVYERHHFANEKTIKYDEKRKHYIMSRLNCKFIILEDKNGSVLDF